VKRSAPRRPTTTDGSPGQHAAAREDVRPSLTLEQATALLKAAEKSRQHAYITLCLLTGIRSEEARALTWELSHSLAVTRPGRGGRIDRYPPICVLSADCASAPWRAA
jgi:integrase